MRIILIAVGISFCLLTAGCWDRVEIQDRGIVKAMGIDIAPEEIPPGESFAQARGGKKYMVSFQLIRLSQESGRAAKSERKTYVITNTGGSLFEILRDALGQSSKVLNFEHLDAIIISEAVVKEGGIKPLIDFFIREPEFRWRTRLYITKGSARAIVEYQPPTGEAGGQFINSIANNQFRDAHLATARTDLGYTTVTLDNDADAAIPLIELNKDTLKMGGAAVFQNDKFVGYFDEYAIKGLRLARQLQKSAAIAVECPGNPDKLLTLKMTKAKSTIDAAVDAEGLFYNINVEVEGNLEEFQCEGDHKLDVDFAPIAGELFAREIDNNILYALHKSQAMRIDPTGFMTREIKAHNPKLWRQIESNWREVFAAARIFVNTQVLIKNLGDHR